MSRLLFCPYKMHTSLQEKYGRSREVIPDIHCPQDEFYYWNRQNIMRTFKNGHIWTSIYVDFAGFQLPSGYIRKIR